MLLYFKGNVKLLRNYGRKAGWNVVQWVKQLLTQECSLQPWPFHFLINFLLENLGGEGKMAQVVGPPITRGIRMEFPHLAARVVCE